MAPETKPSLSSRISALLRFLHDIFDSFWAYVISLFSQLRAPTDNDSKTIHPQDSTAPEAALRQIDPASASQVPPAPTQHYQPNRRKDNTPPWKKRGEILALAIAFGLLVINFFALLANKKAADAAASANRINRESLISTQRAFIGFGRFDTKSRVVRQAGKDKRVFVFSAMLRNDGNTPAVDVINSFTISIQKSEPTSEQFIRVPKRSDYSTTFVGPKGEVVLGPENLSDVDIMGFTFPETKEKLKETIFVERDIFFFGWVAYRDVFPDTKVHVTEFCHQLRGVSLDSKSTPGSAIYNFAFSVCRAHNCSDEYCENYSQLEALALGK